MSSSAIQSPTSVLLRNTSRLAPMSRCPRQPSPGLEKRENDFFQKESCEFIPTVPNSQPVCGIHHPDQGVRFLEIVSPIRAKRLLASYIPFDTVALVLGSKEGNRAAHRYSVCNYSYYQHPIFIGETFLPLIINRSDNESQGWADSADILLHDLLDDGGFPCIVQAAGSLSERDRALAVLTASKSSSPCPSSVPFLVLTASCLCRV